MGARAIKDFKNGKYIVNPVLMEQSISSSARWPQGCLIAFRFFFAYFIFYMFPFPLNYLPKVSVVYQPLTELSTALCTYIAKSLTGFDPGIHGINNGSGDTTLNYARLYLFTAYSLVITIVWSLADRRRRNYDKLWYWLTILLRYYLAVTMISYGMAKIFKTQFGFPSLDRLHQSFGDASPMGLLWTFMGYSTAYNIFTGAGEFVGGLLLFFRRTRLIGALIVIVVMSHVAMLNFAYDVPVKLFSLHLLSMAIFLIVPDAKNILNIFLFNKPTLPEIVKPIYYNGKTRWFYFIAKGLFVGFILTTNTMNQIDTRKEIARHAGDANRFDPLMGEFVVESFELNGELVPPGKMDTRRWGKVTINKKNIDIQSTDGGSIPWHFHGNSKKIVLLSKDLSTMGNFRFEGDSTRLILQGVLNEDSLKIKLKRKSADSFVLVTRGFHWINEYPFYK
ncbi:MAG TPA: DoxX family protein [Chryseolinea sp.]